MVRSPPSSFPRSRRTDDESEINGNGQEVGGKSENGHGFHLHRKASRATDSLQVPHTEPKITRKPSFVRARQSVSSLAQRISFRSPPVLRNHDDSYDQDGRALFVYSEPQEANLDEDLEIDLKLIKNGLDRLSLSAIVPKDTILSHARAGQRDEAGSMLVPSTPGTPDARTTAHWHASGSNGGSPRRVSCVPSNGSVTETQDPLRNLHVNLHSNQSSMRNDHKPTSLLLPSPNALSKYDYPYFDQSGRTDPSTPSSNRLSVAWDVDQARPADPSERTADSPVTLGTSSATSALPVSATPTSPMGKSEATVD